MSVDTTLRCRLLTSVAEFEALAADWDVLLRESPGATAFQSSGFYLQWWRYFGDDKELRIAVARRGERLVGAVPLQRVRRRIAGRCYSILEFAAMPNELDRPVFLLPGAESAVVTALLECLITQDDEWQVLRLDELPAGSWYLDVIGDWARQRGMGFNRRAFHPCPYLLKDGDWTAFASRKSKRFRRRLRQMENRMGKAGRLSYEQADSGGDIGHLVEQFFEVEGCSWKADQGVASGADPAYREFCRALLSNAANGFTGHAIVQTLDGRASAATIGFSRDETFYSLQIAHDKSFDRFSPGTLLEAYEMQWFFETPGLSRYEFLGGSVFNKRRWTETAVPTERIFVHKPHWHLALRDLVKRRIAPSVRRGIAALRGGKRADEIPEFR